MFRPTSPRAAMRSASPGKGAGASCGPWVVVTVVGACGGTDSGVDWYVRHLFPQVAQLAEVAVGQAVQQVDDVRSGVACHGGGEQRVAAGGATVEGGPHVVE
jgi:hypothetical protein